MGHLGCHPAGMVRLPCCDLPGLEYPSLECRFPRSKALLCAMIGTGTQLLTLTFFILCIALWDVFHPYSRGRQVEKMKKEPLLAPPPEHPFPGPPDRALG